MKVIKTELPAVLIMKPQVFGDERGFFFESFNQRRWADLTGIAAQFVQDNHSGSVKGTLRGLHYQIRQSQGKLVRCTAGEVFDVAVGSAQELTLFGEMGRNAPLRKKTNCRCVSRQGSPMVSLTRSHTAEFHA